MSIIIDLIVTTSQSVSPLTVVKALDWACCSGLTDWCNLTPIYIGFPRLVSQVCYKVTARGGTVPVEDAVFIDEEVFH